MQPLREQKKEKSDCTKNHKNKTSSRKKALKQQLTVRVNQVKKLNQKEIQLKSKLRRRKLKKLRVRRKKKKLKPKLLCNSDKETLIQQKSNQ
jgi:hypothetical protein